MVYKIYLAGSVRGATSSVSLASIITILEKYGKVLTKKLGGSGNIDGQLTDEEIHREDMEWIRTCDFLVAECSSPSLGVGYAIASAVSLNKPVLALQDGKSLLSAMINGDPKIVKRIYTLESLSGIVENFIVECVPQHFPTSFCFLGPPGSGKSTVVKRLQDQHGIVSISTGQILRDMKPDNEYYTIVHQYMDSGQLVPADVMTKIVKKRFSQLDVRTCAFAIDGYPPSKEDLQTFQEMNYVPSIVFLFQVSDDTAVQRQCGRGTRSTDNPETAKLRVLEFKDKVPNLEILQNEWFPKSLVLAIDAEKDSEQVYREIQHIVNSFLPTNKVEHSYMPLFSQEPRLNDRFHFHIDGKDLNHITQVCHTLFTQNTEARALTKVYPIDFLHLGPQKDSDPCYDRMINFHEIGNKQDSQEAFVTGKLGTRFLPKVMKNVLSACQTSVQENGLPVMTELEQYIIQTSFSTSGQETITADYRNDILDINLLALYPQFSHCFIPNSEQMEIHFGFDIPKNGDQPVIDLIEFVNKCSQVGLNFGGTFIFKDPQVWKYRTNEFRKCSPEEAVQTMYEQYAQIRKILDTYGQRVDISCSVEVVHGIYDFQ